MVRNKERIALHHTVLFLTNTAQIGRADPKQALEYADMLKPLADRLENLVVVMRTYPEKPRTTVGWKGLINDPDLDSSYKINKGLRTTRQLYADVTDRGLPVAVELLDSISPQFLADAVSWGVFVCLTLLAAVTTR